MRLARVGARGRRQGRALGWRPRIRRVAPRRATDDGATQGTGGGSGSEWAGVVLVFIVAGLRPESVNPEDTPNLYRLAREGVQFTDAHAVFPTATWVNAAAIGTGTYPGTNGILGNVLSPSRRHPVRPAKEWLGPPDALAEADSRPLLCVDSMADELHRRGRRLAVVSSGSTGSALLLNPRAPHGTGVLVKAGLGPAGRVAYPDEVNRDILERFGAAAPTPGRSREPTQLVDWTQRVLVEYVLPVLRPAVVLNWFDEPDHTQHRHGAGSPQAHRAIRQVDRSIGLTLERITTHRLTGAVNVLVVSDHGHARLGFAVDIQRDLIRAGLKASPGSDEVIVATDGACALLYVKDHRLGLIADVVGFLLDQDWAGVVFTAATPPRPPEPLGSGDRVVSYLAEPLRPVDPNGWVDGTFSLELIHAAQPERGPDIVCTFPWTSDRNEFGVSGTDVTTGGGCEGAGVPPAARSGHGGMSPWTVRTTFTAWGADFKRGATIRVPVSLVDIVPTILALEGVGQGTPRDGRVLLEALTGGPDEEQVSVTTHTYTTTTSCGRYRAAIQVSEVGHQRYVDKSWRLPGMVRVHPRSPGRRSPAPPERRQQCTWS
jgi:predicted AlkP superfamily pyrophosphatase or phosphodiesterase